MREGKDPGEQTMSAMSHTIIVPLDIGVMPVSPLLLHRKDSDGNMQP